MTNPSSSSFDLAIVGAGIVGLAHALAATRLGKRVVVIDRDAQANGASIRNFGFITVTGQQSGECWRRARRSRDIWDEIAPQAGIQIVHRGLDVVARRPSAARVLQAFMETEMAEHCSFFSGSEAAARFPQFTGKVAGILHSDEDLRVESRIAIPKLAAWLEQAKGVTFLRNTTVHAVEPPRIVTSSGTIEAEAAVVCGGDDFSGLFADRIAAYGLTRCKLHMMRARPDGGFRLDSAVMTDLSLVRYLGYADLPEAAALKQELIDEQPAFLANGIHLITVRSADGSLVLGDSHHYGPTPDPFAPESVDDLIIDEYEAVFGHRPRVTERWVGTYASAADRLMLMDKPRDDTRIVIVTSGTGASTSFAIAEETLADLYG